MDVCRSLCVSSAVNPFASCVQFSRIFARVVSCSVGAIWRQIFHSSEVTVSNSHSNNACPIAFRVQMSVLIFLLLYMESNNRFEPN